MTAHRPAAAQVRENRISLQIRLVSAANKTVTTCFPTQAAIATATPVRALRSPDPPTAFSLPAGPVRGARLLPRRSSRQGRARTQAEARASGARNGADRGPEADCFVARTGHKARVRVAHTAHVLRRSVQSAQTPSVALIQNTTTTLKIAANASAKKPARARGVPRAISKGLWLP